MSPWHHYQATKIKLKTDLVSTIYSLHVKWQNKKEQK